MSEQKELVKIGQAAKLAGVSTQTLQYYLMLDLLTPAAVTEKGWRLFDSKNIEKIILIKNLNKSGYPLRDIREIFVDGRTR